MQFFKTKEMSPERQPLLQNQHRTTQAESNTASNASVSNDTPASISSLDLPTILHIASFLPPEDVAAFNLTCKEMYQTLHNEPIPSARNKEGKAVTIEEISATHGRFKENKKKLAVVEENLEESDRKMERVAIIGSALGCTASLGIAADICLLSQGVISGSTFFGSLGAGSVALCLFGFFGNKIANRHDANLMKKTEEKITLQEESENISKSLQGPAFLQMTK